MKRLIYTILTVACLVGTTQVFAQKSNDDFQYRKSSLTMILLDYDYFPNKDIIMKTWNNYTFPVLYNEHNIDFKSIDINSIVLSEQDFLDAGFLKDTLKKLPQVTKAEQDFKPLRYLNEYKSKAVVLPTEEEEYQVKIGIAIKKHKLANKVVAAWFNRSKEGKFDMSIIQKRGFYNASELEAGIAQGNAKDMIALRDAGEELLKNTFITFTKFEFIGNEPAAAIARDKAKAELRKRLSGKPIMILNQALKGADATYEKAKEGFSVWTKTWLYRLNWNDEIAATFFNDLWSNPDAFDQSDLFTLEFVGVEYNASPVTFEIAETKEDQELVHVLTVRNLDEAFAELQDEYDIFKPRVPILTVNPITAQIGMKEGIEGGESFDVLEMIVNPKTGLTEYKRVGKVSADKKIIWNNIYRSKEEKVLGEDGNPITATQFKGGKSIQPGMLLRRTK